MDFSVIHNCFMIQNTGHTEGNNLCLSLGLVYYFNASIETVSIRGRLLLQGVH